MPRSPVCLRRKAWAPDSLPHLLPPEALHCLCEEPRGQQRASAFCKAFPSKGFSKVQAPSASSLGFPRNNNVWKCTGHDAKKIKTSFPAGIHFNITSTLLRCCFERSTLSMFIAHFSLLPMCGSNFAFSLLYLFP